MRIQKTRISPLHRLVSAMLVMALVVVSVPATGIVSPSLAAATCTVPLGGSASARSAVVKDAYQTWKATYVTADGAGGDLRVQRSSFDNFDTVSEGIAYGMLFAVYNNDKTTFDGLWGYAQKHFNQNGVMNWRIAADGSTIGYNGATDADEDMAAALVAADTTWGGYKDAAVTRINTIMTHQVEAGTNVVKPGDVWGGSALLNPSYLAPSYYEVFAAYTSDARWTGVKTVSHQTLQAAQNPTTGLIPDWSTSSGAATSGMSHNYGYDASRAPLRLALGASWTCGANDVALLAPYNAWFAGQDVSKLASSYSLNGTVQDKGDATPVLAATASAALTSQNEAHRTATWNTLVAAPSTSYYPDSMRLFGLLVASGVMVKPTELAKQTPVTTVTMPTIAKTYALSTADTSATVGVAKEFSLTVTTPQPRGNLLVDLELYDAQNRQVAQKVYENQSLSSDGTTYTLSWTPTAPGTYSLRGGIFTASWKQNLHWNNGIAPISVTRQAAPVVPAVPIVAPVVPVTPAAPVATSPVVVAEPAATPVVVPVAQPVTPPVVLPVVTLPTVPVIPVVTNPIPVTPTPSAPTTQPTPTQADLGIWWPGSTQSVSGVQPFKAVVNGRDLSTYDMYWQVDGDQLNRMDSINDSAPHKLSLVDLKYWTWQPSNKYTITFVAKNTDGTVIAQKAVVITVGR